MARKETIIVTYTDDITGDEVPEDELVTLQFAVGSQAYSIDLSAESAEKFESLMHQYVSAARLTARNVKGTPRKVMQSDMKANLAAIRTWAREHGYEVSDRGRVAQQIVKAYSEAQSRTRQDRSVTLTK